MPIYAYRCTECGHAQDVLQKISDPVLTQCPACGAMAYAKQVTAAGFQLKGSGWYVTDFRDGNKAAARKDGAAAPAEPGATPPADAKPAAGGEAGAAAAPAKAAETTTPAAPAAAPSPTPAPGG